MRLSKEHLGELVVKASTLVERLEGNFERAADNDRVAARRLARWMQTAADNDPERFAKVLTALGINSKSAADLEGMVGSIRHNASTPLPDWALFLNDLIEGLSREFLNDGCGNNRAGDGRFGACGKIPFEHLFQPMSELAWWKVEEIDRLGGLLNNRARQHLQAFLCKRISGIAALPLQTAFLAHRAFVQASVGTRLFSAETVQVERPLPHANLYQEFVEKQGQEGLSRFFARYPVAAKLIAEVTLQWIDTVGEFLRRLADDQSVLSTQFNAGEPVGIITGIKPGISDPHHGGRTVMIVTFSSNLRLVYKPRSVEVDCRFFDLVQAINDAGLHLGLRVLKVLDRQNYGWMEFVQHRACDGRPASRRYYQRAGGLVALVHWLRGTDCHRENLIAAGEQPILVDLETLAHQFRADEISSVAANPVRASANSILRTGLLPVQHRFADSLSRYDQNGLDAPVFRRAPVESVQWSRINTNRMGWRLAKRARRQPWHRPKLRLTLSIRNYELETLAGFRNMANILRNPSSTRLLRLRQAIYDCPRREVKRPTLLYMFLLQRSCAPQYLAHGIDRSIELQALPLGSDVAQFTQEIASLEAMDVPWFKVQVLSPGNDTRIDDYAIAPSFLGQERILKLAIRRELEIRDGAICLRKSVPQNGGGRFSPPARSGGTSGPLRANER